MSISFINFGQNPQATGFPEAYPISTGTCPSLNRGISLVDSEIMYHTVELSPSIHKVDNEFIQTSAERLDLSSPKVSSICLSRSPQDLVLPSAMRSIRPELMAEGGPNGVSNCDAVNNQNTFLYLRMEALRVIPNGGMGITRGVRAIIGAMSDEMPLALVRHLHDVPANVARLVCTDLI